MIASRRSAPTLLLATLLFVACSGGGGGEEPAGGGDTLADAGGDADGCQAGDPCDDFDPCTVDDQCLNGGFCKGTPKDCGADLACATMECDPEDGACVEIGIGIEAGWCLLDDACVEGGVLNPTNDCEFCNPEAAQNAWSDVEFGASCEDGNPCTENDSCDTGVCFAGTPPSCADGIQCTVDACDPDEGCSH